MTIKKMFMCIVFVCSLLLVVRGCGSKAADLNVFIMPEKGLSAGADEKLQQSLQTKIGETFQVKVITAIMLDMQKLSIEIVAAQNGVIIVPEEPFKLMVRDGGPIDLSDMFNKEDYPQYVFDGKLYGVPIHESKWFKDIAYKGSPLIAFIPINAPDIEKAKQALKAIAEK